MLNRGIEKQLIFRSRLSVMYRRAPRAALNPGSCVQIFLKVLLVESGGEVHRLDHIGDRNRAIVSRFGSTGLLSCGTMRDLKVAATD